MKKINKYAVIRLNGKQYKVSEGQEILVDKIVDEKLQPEVLLYVEDNKTVIGKPVVEKVKVKIKLLGDIKGDKIDVVKYKSKSRYRKKIGFRPTFSKVNIESITS